MEVRHKDERWHGCDHERERRLVGIPAPEESLGNLFSCNGILGSALAKGGTVYGPAGAPHFILKKSRGKRGLC